MELKRKPPTLYSVRQADNHVFYFHNVAELLVCLAAQPLNSGCIVEHITQQEYYNREGAEAAWNGFGM